VAAVVLVVVATIGLGLVAVGHERSVDTAARPARCTPRAEGWTGFVPSTPAKFVRGRTHAKALPDAVVRVQVVRVRSSKRRQQQFEENLFSVDPELLPKLRRRPTVEHRAVVKVTASIAGPAVGSQLVISDSAEADMIADLAHAKRTVQAKVDQFEAILEVNPDAKVVRAQFEDYQQRLQSLQLAERLMTVPPLRPLPCHRLRPGDDVVVALVKQGDEYELTGANSFFVVDGDRFSTTLDADRQTLPGWKDSALQRLARTSTPAEFLAALRAAR